MPVDRGVMGMTGGMMGMGGYNTFPTNMHDKWNDSDGKGLIPSLQTGE